MDELARFPLSLAGIYSLILRNIGRIERRGRTVAETIFRWLLCTDDAGCDVTIAACSGTASTEGRSLSISDILDVCSNLVVYEEALDRFRFAHLSVREFLESQPGYTPIAANEFVLERSLQRLTYQQTNRDPFWSYATLHWGFHYNRLGELHRKEVFELHAKRFLFNGVESSDAFNVWATEVHKLNWDLLESKSFHSPQLYIVKGNFRSPVELASYFGWLEILDHFKGNQSSNDIYGPAAKMMTVAIRSGQTSVVRWLLDRSFYPMDEHLKQAFHYQRLEIVQTFLDMNFLSPNTIVGGEEVLSLVIRCSLGDLYQDLIKKGANVHHRDEHGRTLLFHAVSSPANNHSKIIEDLLLTGIDPSAQDNAGRTPLSLSLWGKHQPRFYSLLACKVYHYSTSTNGEDVLRRVSQSYDYHIACLLLHYGLDSMLKDVDMRAEWMEILSLIATHPDLQCEAMASLARRSGKLSNGPEDQMQLAGQTLLSLAALLRHEKAFRVLLNWGIDPTCPAICEVRKKTSIVSQIGHCMSRPEPLNHKGESNDNRMSDELRQGPLAWAAYSGNIPLVQSIIERALDANIKNRKGQTALYFAVQHTEDNCFDSETDKDVMVRLLLQKGALVTSADDYGGATLLAHAFKARSGTMVKLLLENGAEIPRGALVGPAEQLWDAFHQGQDGIRQALLERIQGAQVDSMHRQSPSSTFDWSGDPLGTAAQFIWGGTMRVFGDVLLTACGDIDNAT